MTDAREIAALAAMPRILDALGFVVNERTRRCPCLIHGGSNTSAFFWREDGRWRCFSCGASGDRIALVRVIRQCSFREAIEFLAQLAGVEYLPGKSSCAKVAEINQHRESSELLAWHIRDEILRLRIYYCDALHRSERLLRRIGEGLHIPGNEACYNAIWDRLARLAPTTTYFLAAQTFVAQADTETLARFALASPSERRATILGENLADTKLHAA